ncbi:MAG: RluA family pseudouridine synthase [Acidimicrobiales bacterium]
MSHPTAAPDAGGVVNVVVPEALGGERIDRVVAMLTSLSRAEATDVVRSGGVTVDGVIAERGADRLEVGASLVIAPRDQAADLAPVADPGIEVAVVYADAAVIVVDKPAGLVVHPGAGHEDDTLVNGLLVAYPELAGVGDSERPGIVHRLDRGTSGLLVVARTPAAYLDLVSQLAARTVDRQYRALVWGHPEAPRGVVEAPIGRSPRSPTKMAVTESGKAARTRYEVVATFDAPAVVSELTCRLETGRTHQIRVHLAAIGHPVVGDDRYRGVRQSLPCPRPYLHAEHLGFDHPTTGEHLAFDAALPLDLQAVHDRLG